MEINKGLELVSTPHFSYNFLIKNFVLQYNINWPNFITRVCFLPKLCNNMCFVFHVKVFDDVMLFDYLKRCSGHNLKKHFFSEHLRWLPLYFFKRWLNSYFATSLWCANNFFFSTHCLMYEKSNSLAYKFVVNRQVFWITPSGCTL